jgi:S-adenosylmethionine hydrolase
VFVVVVDPGVGTQRRSIVLRTQTGQRFVGPDNGVLSGVMAEQGVDRVWQIQEEQLAASGRMSSTFHGRDIYGPIGGRLAAGMSPDDVGPQIDDPVQLVIHAPVRAGLVFEGQIVHVDHYGNIATNIPAHWLSEGAVGLGEILVVIVGDRRWPAQRAKTYADVAPGELLVLASAEGTVEVARNRASAGERLAAKAGDVIRIEPHH